VQSGIAGADTDQQKTDFNVLLGLCVGHDSLFLKYAEAPCTVLAVKDRMLGHNPLAAEKKKIGLNEVKLGVPVPYLADMILRHIIGNRYATQMIFSSEFMSFEDAKIIGRIDVIGSAEELEDFTIERLSQIASYPSEAFAAAKANKVEEIKGKYEKHFKEKNEEFLDCWFSDPVQQNLLECYSQFLP
jgi:enoyl-CoA hydratase/carnithine racemase